MDREDEAEFDAFVHASSRRLLHAAFLLTGDRGRAQDLVQLALERTCIHWRSAAESPHAYARTVMVHQATDWWRARRWVERPLGDWDAPDPGPDLATAVATHDLVVRVMGVLTARERAVVMLRYFEDLSEMQIAQTLQVGPGTVKSTANRALAKLRVAPEMSEDEPKERTR